MTGHTIAALQDKSSSVRRYSIALLTKLILTHPFGLIHGGHLNLSEWEERYEAVCKELKSLEDSAGTAGLEAADNSIAVDDEEAQDGEEEDDDDDDEEDEDDDGEDEDEEQAGDDTPTRPRVKREAAGDDADEDDEEDGDGSPKPKKTKKVKRSKKKSKEKRRPRKSGVDLAAAISQEQANAALNSQEYTRLKLTKKYITDALFFIRSVGAVISAGFKLFVIDMNSQIEDARPILTDLLVSTNKAEVLESMTFFQTASDYHLECAEVRTDITFQSKTVDIF